MMMGTMTGIPSWLTLIGLGALMTVLWGFENGGFALSLQMNLGTVRSHSKAQQPSLKSAAKSNRVPFQAKNWAERPSIKVLKMLNKPTPRFLFPLLIALTHNGLSSYVVNHLSSYLESYKKPIVVKEFNQLIKATAQRGDFGNCDKILTLMNQYKIFPNIITFSTLISRAATWHQSKLAQHYFSLLHKHDIRPDTQIYNSLINSYVKVGDMDAALDVLDDLFRAGEAPSVVTCNTLMDGYARLGDLEGIYRIMKQFETYDQYEISLNDRSYFSLVRAHCECGDFVGAEEVISKMKDKGVLPTIEIYSVLVHSYGSRGLVKQAINQVERMQRDGISPNFILFSSLIHACGKSRMLNEAFSCLDVMLNSSDQSMQPNAVTFSSLVDSCLKAGEVDKAFNVLRFMRSRRIDFNEVTITSVLTELSKLGQLHRLPEILGKSSQKKLNKKTTNASDNTASLTKDLDDSEQRELLNSMPNASFLQFIHRTARILKSNEVSPEVFDGMTSLAVKRVSNPAELSKLILLLSSALDENEHPNVDLYIQELLSLLAIGEDKDQAQRPSIFSPQFQQPEHVHIIDRLRTASNNASVVGETYDQLRSSKDGLNSSEYIALVDSVFQASNNTEADRKTRRQDQLYQAFLLFRELKGTKTQLDTVIYNSLISACAAAGEFEKALQTFDEMQFDEIPPDVITYTSLLKACSVAGSKQALVVGEEIFASMQQRTNHFSTYIAPNNQTYCQYVSMMARCNNKYIVIPTLRQIYEQIKAKDIIIDGNVFYEFMRGSRAFEDLDFALEMIKEMRLRLPSKFHYKSWSLTAMLLRSQSRMAEAEAFEKELRTHAHA